MVRSLGGRVAHGFRCPLAGDVDLQALGDMPDTFAPDGCRERSLHGFIVSQGWETIRGRFVDTIIRP